MKEVQLYTFWMRMHYLLEEVYNIICVFPFLFEHGENLGSGKFQILGDSFKKIIWLIKLCLFNNLIQRFIATDTL